MQISTSLPVPSPAESLLRDYSTVRGTTERLCDGLATEDYVVQSMPDVSPTKWHLAHTSWFFEQFVLRPHAPSYRPLNEQYAFLFNSYYTQAGERHCRAQRGYISRPTVDEVYAYRAHVDRAIESLLHAADDEALQELQPLLTLGLNHEQQHQELLLMDIKHVFSVNPLRPVYQARPTSSENETSSPLGWIEEEGGLLMVGHSDSPFAYDNERPAHRVFLEPFALGDRLVTNSEYLDFMEDGGYRRPELWLSLGWAQVQQEEWKEPFYWERRDGRWWYFTLSGMRPVAMNEPVSHLSYLEADAYARWAGARLPSEAEWEVVARKASPTGNLLEEGALHPRAADPAAPGLRQLFGDLWEWTRSPYAPYPGFRPADGALGEYNGKFMCNQFVLRGGSCVTPRTHIRASYRNFFPPEATWQFSGVRLARDV